MKNLLFIFVILAFPWQESYAQKASGFLYDDALTFYNKTRTGAVNKSHIVAILTHYANRPLTLAETISLMDSTKLLEPYATLIAIADTVKTKGVEPQAGSAINTNLTATNFADGIAKFLIDRGKQEISTAFFERMRNEFNRCAELKYLLPNTYAIVRDMESHNILNLLQELRDATIKDLNTMPTNILSFRSLTPADIVSACTAGDTKACKNRIESIQKQLDVNAEPGAAAMARVFTLIVMQSLIDGDDIITIFNRISGDIELCKKNEGFIAYTKLTTILINSLKTSKESEGLFISSKDITNLLQNKELFNIWLGLTSVKYTHDACFRGVTIKGAKLDSIISNIASSRNKLNEIAAIAAKVNRSYLMIVGKVESPEPIQGLYNSLVSNSVGFAATSIQLFANIGKEKVVEKVPGAKTIADSIARTHVSRFVENLKISADFSVDIRNQNYAGIFVDLTKLITTNNILGNDVKIKDAVLKYLSFGANLASATTSDEVKAAIDAIALPAGSYSVKRSSKFNIALNGYIGYGWDRTSKGIYARGVYAPVGLSISTGLKGWSSITFFAGVIDVGAIASYRLMDNSTDALKQDVRLESIVSPSAQLFFGIPKLPIVVGGGWRRTPRLFYDNQTTFISVVPKDVFNLSVLIDIPIVNIVNVR